MEWITVYYVVSPVLGFVLPLGLSFVFKPEIALPLAEVLGEALKRAAKTPKGLKSK